jgi:hypothetical protein
MAQLMPRRLKDIRKNYVERKSGGIGAFTPDNLPVIDWILPNVCMIADSNHGYRLTGVGKLVARHPATGGTIGELQPFAFSRCAEGRTFSKTNSNSPWV